MRRLLPDFIGVSVSYPLPGTRFHDRVRQDLAAGDHWRDSQDLAMLFRGPFPTAIYRRVHRLLHAEHEALLAVERAATDARRSAAQERLDEAREAWPILERAALAASSIQPELRLAEPAPKVGDPVDGTDKT